MPRDTLVLLSGGVDSAVLLWDQRDRVRQTLTIRYGQPAYKEEERAADALAFALGNDVIRTSTSLPMSGLSEMKAGPGVQGPRVVPGRNLLLIATAIQLAASFRLTRVVLGATADDDADYPDCRAGFRDLVDQVARDAYGVEVAFPLVHQSKADVIRLGLDLGVPLHLTWSCYQPVDLDVPCGGCSACVRRADAFAAAGVVDRA